METFKPLELMEKRYSINIGDYVCSGDNGRIYVLGKDKIAKVPYNHFNNQLCNDRNSQFKLFKEYQKQKLAIELGLNYPEVEGLFAIKENNNGLYYPGLVMKYLNGGETLDKLCGDKLDKARRQRDSEIGKARELGIFIGDNHKNNAILYNGEIYLLDAADLKIWA
jgi:hypothetical protein